jgi:hypothetical protein
MWNEQVRTQFLSFILWFFNKNFLHRSKKSIKCVIKMKKVYATHCPLPLPTKYHVLFERPLIYKTLRVCNLSNVYRSNYLIEYNHSNCLFQLVVILITINYESNTISSFWTNISVQIKCNFLTVFQDLKRFFVFSLWMQLMKHFQCTAKTDFICTSMLYNTYELTIKQQ